MATSQAFDQAQDIQALPEFQRDHIAGELNGIVSDRDTELVAATMLLENAIRAFGVEPTSSQLSPQDLQPRTEIVPNPVKPVEQTPISSYEQVVTKEAQKAEASHSVDGELNADDKLAAVHKVHDDSDAVNLSGTDFTLAA